MWLTAVVFSAPLKLWQVKVVGRGVGPAELVVALRVV
jgi:hypothetical protein